MKSRSFLIAVVAVAVISSALTWLVGQQIQSPAERAAAAEAPEASLLTVPVERKKLSQNVVVRGTIKPSDFVEVSASSSSESSTIVTGLPKDTGDDVDEGEVIAEISGRPIIALQGKLPVFRDLRPGVVGPDVLQLEEALSRLGYSPGPIDETYTTATGNAVTALYKANGYPEKGRSKEDQEALRSARTRVADSQREVTAAKNPTGEGTGRPTESERLQLDLAITQAEGELADAKAVAAEEPTAANKRAVKVAETNVKIAKAARTEATNPTANADAESVAAAERALKESQEDVERLETETGTSFPSAELVFVATLPQQVIRVNNDLGDKPSEAVLVVSGSETVIRSAVSATDRKLLSEGMKATIDEDDFDLKADVTVKKIATKPGGGKLKDNQYSIELVATKPLPEEVVDSSVRVTIPVTSSEGEVLVVPLSAVSAGPDGKSRVEVQTDPESKDTTLVPVKVGLTAGGSVEVEALPGAELAEKDRVVVGKDLALPTDEDSQDEDDQDEDDGE